jgi:hypothetical protein
MKLDMRIYLVLILLAYCFESRAQQGIIIDPSNLSWANYKGTVDSITQMYAATNTGYEISIDGRKVKVCAYFYPSVSWVKMFDLVIQRSPGYIDSLLIHERLHYSITILTAKKVKQFLERNRVRSSSELNAVNKQFHIWRDSLNAVYDADSDHGDDVLGQDKWNKQIEKQLDSLVDIRLEKAPI